MSYLVQKELIEQILKYLADRPYKETAMLISQIMKSIHDQNEKNKASDLHEEQRPGHRESTEAPHVASE